MVKIMTLQCSDADSLCLAVSEDVSDVNCYCPNGKVIINDDHMLFFYFFYFFPIFSIFSIFSILSIAIAPMERSLLMTTICYFSLLYGFGDWMTR